MKKLFAVLLILPAAACLFAGGAKAQKAPEGISVLSLFVNPTEDANSRAFYGMTEKFAKDFPSVKVSYEGIPHDEYETKMKTYVAAGEYPDIYQVKGTMIPQLADDGVIYTAKEIMDLIPGWEAGFKGGVFEDFTYKNTAYALPMQMGNNHNIFYNTDIFRECGITEFPGDWNSFADAMDRIKAKGYIPIVQGNKANWLIPSLLFNTIVYRFTGIDWYYSLRENRGAKFTDRQFVAAAALLQDMAKKGYFNTDINSIDQHQMYTVYYNKKAAMMVDGFWGVGRFVAEMPKDVLAATKIAQFPAVPESMGGGGAKYAKINQAAAGWGYVITKRKDDTPDRRKAMAQLVQYITGPEYANIVVEYSGLPASKTSSVDESKLSTLYRELLALNNESQYAPVFDVQLNPQIVDAFYSNTQELLIGAITPQRYAELIQAETDATR
ncbi:MAG: extracellular solute-binding protein [Treponema sp.]|jgi:raffinose/stachyose/melibiose transport system substrate-binding protein|nr:extracellular solute-binding protein [Treponema sp.]